MPDQTVFALLVHVGRKPGDGLPEGAEGAALLCYASGRDEAEAVRETVRVIKDAGLAVLEVEGHGEAPDDAHAGRALSENAVVVVDKTLTGAGAGAAADGRSRGRSEGGRGESSR